MDYKKVLGQVLDQFYDVAKDVFFENGSEFVELIIKASKSGNYNQIKTKLVELFQKIYNAADSIINKDQLEKLRSDYFSLLIVLDKNKDFFSRIKLITNFIYVNKDIIKKIFLNPESKSNKTSIKKYLDPLNIVKNKYNQYKQKALKKKILEKEAKFIKNNKEKKRKKK